MSSINSENRQLVFRASVTPEQLADLRARAAAENMDIHEYVNTVVTGTRPTVELGAIGRAEIKQAADQLEGEHDAGRGEGGAKRRHRRADPEDGSGSEAEPQA